MGWINKISFNSSPRKKTMSDILEHFLEPLKNTVILKKGLYHFLVCWTKDLWRFWTYLIQIDPKCHTLAIWTFTFHKKPGFVKVILKENFKPSYRPVSWTFLSENSDLLRLFFFYVLQEFSNPLLFEHSYCYFKKVEMFESHFCIKLQLKCVKSLE